MSEKIKEEKDSKKALESGSLNSEELLEGLSEEDLKMIDSILESKTDEALILQESNTVRWRVEGLIDEETGELLPPRILKKDNPILVIESIHKETGEENFTSFVLSPEFARTLGEVGKVTYEAYYGIKPKEHKKSLKDLPGDLGDWIKSNKVLSLVIAVLLAALFASAVSGISF